MMTPRQWTALALSLPESEQKSHFEKPDFRVGNKIFAGLDQNGVRGNLKLSPETQELALMGNPAGFTPCAGAWGQKGWTYVELAHVQEAEVRGLMLEAYRSVAPKKLLAGLGDVAAASKKPAASPLEGQAKSKAVAAKRKGRSQKT